MLHRFLNQKQALENEPEEKKRKFTRSKGDTSNNCQECFFCEKAGQEKLHEASTFRIDRRVRECVGLLKDDKLLAKLSVGDMVALEVKYHQTCLVRLYNRARKLKREENKESSNNSSDSIDLLVAFAELIAYLYDEREGSVETSGSSPVFKLSEITKLYEKRLNDFGIERMRGNSHHLKNRLLGLCPEIRSFNQGRDCYIAFDEDIGDILKDVKERNYDGDAVVLAKAADIIRREFRTEVSWSLDQIDCQEECIPKTLLRFIQMV